MSNFVYATLSKDRDYIDALTQIQETEYESEESARYIQIFKELNLCMQIIMDPGIVNTGRTLQVLKDVILAAHAELDDTFVHNVCMDEVEDPKSRHLVKCMLMLRKLEELYIEGAVAAQAQSEGRRVTQEELDNATGRTKRRQEEAIGESFQQ